MNGCMNGAALTIAGREAEMAEILHPKFTPLIR